MSQKEVIKQSVKWTPPASISYPFLVGEQNALIDRSAQLRSVAPAVFRKKALATRGRFPPLRANTSGVWVVYGGKWAAFAVCVGLVVETLRAGSI